MSKSHVSIANRFDSLTALSRVANRFEGLATDIDTEMGEVLDAALNAEILTLTPSGVAGVDASGKGRRSRNAGYQTRLDGMFALLTDAYHGKPGTYAKRYATEAKPEAKPETMSDADILAALVACEARLDAALDETPNCATCDRLARHKTRCRAHA